MGKAIVNEGDESKEVQINDLIFKELIKRGYSLEGNTRVWNIADSKLWYLTPEQAQSYLKLENSTEYKKGVVNAEFDLVEENMNLILENLENCPVNVIDLGCGDGKKGAHVVENLLKKGIKVRYCPIDISGYMVQQAIDRLSEINVDDVIESQYNISDFENLENIVPLLSSETYKKNLFLLLGYTLGNFEIHEILYEIRSAMNDGDLFVVIDGLASDKWQERAKTAKDDKHMNDFLKLMVYQLGLSPEDIEFGSRFRNSRIEFYYTIKEDKNIEFQGKKADFKEGDQIIVAIAYKHNKADLLTYLNMYFDQVDLKESPDGSTGLAICKK